MNGDLTEAQLSELRADLRRRFDELRAEIRQTLLKSDEEQYVDLAGRVHDTGDESVADLLADVNIALLDNMVHEISAVEHALMRIPDGSYGVCSDCGEGIGFARLKAEPYAVRCLDCQERYERSPGGPGRPSL